MKALLVTTGSRGDVEPFVALARGLADAGHHPTLAAPARFLELAAEHDVAFIALDDSLFELQSSLAHRGTFAAFTGAARAKSALRLFLADVADLADHATDVVVYHPKTLAAPLVAERLGVPSIAVQLIPLYQPTAAFPSPLLSFPIPRALNRLTWRMSSAIEAPWRGMLRTLHRDRLALSTPLTGIADRIAADGALNAWSPHLLPAPTEWPASAEPLGFWRLPGAADEPAPELVDFLSNGEPPVYVGFGSMTSTHPDAVGAAIRDGLRRAGRRGVVVTGAGAVELEGDDSILVLDHVSHDWLLPRTAVAVHHGGVGTVGAALTAGVPQVIRPFLGDQQFWAKRVADIGVGVRLRRLTAESLAAAIAAAETCTPRARALGDSIRARDDGVVQAVRQIEQRVAT
ncbi:glycosyltransferase [Microbacterium sp. MPKO10]|uniref:glycosyltransferase n=1 Tax=Microbacterium sp. MPKO10 TaxID=2989818 RepID=UPI002235FEF7|nr:glycosyltransferase [Microbacterium sp. MPKO10]MCW4457424.1 glycosyltransferase [Microbacterium sp. MPKO10]